MRTHTTSIEIDVPPADAFAFLADGEQLPAWAVEFARGVEPDGEGWIVTLAGGERLALRIDADPATGVVDYVALPASGVEAAAHTRVVPHGTGTLYGFSMHQTPDVPDEVFDAQASALARELTILKARLESAWRR